MMRNILLGAVRFMLPAWVGGAALFVITSVLEVTANQPEIDSVVRDALVGLRFPPYYAFGGVLLGCSLVAGGILSLGGCASKRRFQIATALVLTASVLMIVDYIWIYQPLFEMVTPPGKARTPRFETLHDASKHINSVGLLLAAIAGGLFCWSAPDATKA